ncbi:hypothetical protein [Streptomyces hygroscopicus]|uniref:hypothetical protein n=1 Tax=Streptomyces hygroscopicus TaxID=1912 RepID=UPI00340BE123
MLDHDRGEAVDRQKVLSAGVAAGAIRSGISGRVLLRALGGICGMRAKGWEDDAVRITEIFHDGLRYGAASHS